MAKKQFANLATSDFKNSKMKFIHFRIFSIYGKEDRETSLLKQLVKSFKENKDITLSSCEYKWNFLYIDDFTDMIYKFITKNVDTGTYDIASIDTRLLKDYIIEAHHTFAANNKLLFGKRPDSLETFAIPDIKNTLNSIGNMKFIKFSDGILKII
jgi:nucleoside-diphosphate-sugar epimerase